MPRWQRDRRIDPPVPAGGFVDNFVAWIDKHGWPAPAMMPIWRMRSRVTLNCWPTSSSVWSVFMPMPKRIRSTRSSRGSGWPERGSWFP